MSTYGVGKGLRPKMTDVARRAGVSVGTVSHVLNRRHDAWIGSDARQRVMQAARELGYRPNVLARSLRTQRTRTFGLIFPGMKNDYLINLVEAVYHEARRADYRVLFEPEEAADPENQQKAVDNLLARSVEALVVFWPYGPWMFSAHELFPPTVLIDTEVQIPDGMVADQIRIDRSSEVEAATGYLLGHGRRRVCLVLPKVDDRVTRERAEGWRRAHANAGIPVEEELIFWIARNPPERNVETGCRIGRELLAGGPEFDAVIGPDDYLAVGIMESLIEAGISVPKDVAVVGGGDDHVCMIPPIKLASAARPIDQMAGETVKMLIERIESPEARQPGKSRSFPVKFIPRASCG